MEKLFFTGWDSIIRTLVVTVVAYPGLVLMLRVSGKRTLSKMNSFDLIVTVALGSTLANLMLNKTVALADGFLAFLLLILLQFVVTYFSVRYNTVSRMIKSTPTFLLYKGELLREAMLRERVTEQEIHSAIRQQGFGTEKEVSVVLETDGSLSVVVNPHQRSEGAMKNVE